MIDFRFHKTRIAPTPSGYLHIGNAASFPITSLLAQKAGANVLLRIDDLDKKRVRKEYVQDIFDTLQFLGISWQEGPTDYEDYQEQYSQHHRLALYQNALAQLREEGNVFACRCSRKEQAGNHCNCLYKHISLDEPEVSWRLHTSKPRALSVKTIAGESLTHVLPLSMQSFIVRKKDGFPSYQLSSLVDDDYFGIDAIVRGNDLWESTLAQHYLAQVLQKSFFSHILFHHHPLLTHNGSKLSKSAGATSIQQLRKEGNSRQQIWQLVEEQKAMWLM